MERVIRIKTDGFGTDHPIHFIYLDDQLKGRVLKTTYGYWKFQPWTGVTYNDNEEIVEFSRGKVIADVVEKILNADH